VLRTCHDAPFESTGRALAAGYLEMRSNANFIEKYVVMSLPGFGSSGILREMVPGPDILPLVA
jgi:hypothetical protein